MIFMRMQSRVCVSRTRVCGCHARDVYTRASDPPTSWVIGAHRSRGITT